MVQRHPKRSDQEWMELIQECRTSDLTDKAWCELNHIQRSSLYYHIRRFRNMACEIPDNPVSSCQEQHEVVAVDFSVPLGKAVPLPYSGRAKRQTSGNRSAGMGKLLRMVGTTQSCKKKQAGKSCDIRKKP